MAKRIKTFWKGRRALITGANGFLAGWVVKDLLERGASVAALIYQKNPVSIFETEGLNKLCEVIYSDILDFQSMKRILLNHRIETVFHLGAQAICKTALADPIGTLDANIRGTASILEAVRVTNPKIEIIVASSDKAYGIHKKLPYLETFPLHGEFPYEVSKSCADLISQMYFKTYGIPIAIVRCGNLYGGGDSHFSRIFPRTIYRVSRGLRPVIVSGSVRDYLYVEDAAEGYRLIAENMARLKGEAFNIGCAKPVSSAEVIKLILSAMQKSRVKPIYSKNKSDEIQSQYLSSAKLKRAVGWKPKVNLAEGIRRTVSWYQEFLKKNRVRITD
ncbi:MAG TPA: sugar dehydratase [Candidatus Taylorbacteria bacterium]|nr:MAG: hypothetical protein UY03_C0006G0028 [Parcubacteria group bacterium GW2011_GWA2_47_64]KKU96533.1 MAG: hypothetical protein UY29_C0010G0038 [Parcubacteria group bacterium GW2011_GWC2_48_17]HBV01192.1 sugar dehydratase [Candidatus Taylorbacteria bacterium]